jgi:protein CpxP
MLKQCLLVLLVTSVITIAVPFAAAQDNPPPPPSDQQGPPSHENGGWHHGPPPDPAQRTKDLTKQLNLTADQQTKAQSIFESEHSKMDSIRQDDSLSQDDRHAKMMEIHKGTDTQIRALLDPDQQKKWDEMQAKRGQWMQGRHQGPPDSGQQSPPPPPPQQ